jgi:hypothetical protein
MLGFSLLSRDASKVELLHARSGIRFVFTVSDGTLTDKYTVVSDLSQRYPSRVNVDDQTAIEKLAAVARIAACLHPPPPPLQIVALLPPPAEDKGLST